MDIQQLALTAFLALSSVACDTTPLRVFVYEGHTTDVVLDRSQATDDALMEAQDILGRPLEFSDDIQRGGVMLEFVDVVDNSFPERTFAGGVGNCLPYVRSSRDGWLVAHGLAHALGLDHSDDPDNLMYETDYFGGTYITERQQRRMNHRARVLDACITPGGVWEEITQ
jgi:hypothetical protein